MNLKTLRYYSSNLTIIFLFLAVIVSALVSAGNYFYYKSFIFDKKVSTIGSAFAEVGEGRDFTTVAKEVLNTNKEVLYVKQVDGDGVLQQSFGNPESTNYKEFIVSLTDNSKVFIGIDNTALAFPVELPVLFTTLISLLVLSLFLIALKLYYPYQKESLNKLNEQLVKVSHGDYSAKLEIDSGLKDDVDMIMVFDSFNNMMDSLSGSGGKDKEIDMPVETKADTGSLKLHTNYKAKSEPKKQTPKPRPTLSKPEKSESYSESYNDPIIQEPVQKSFGFNASGSQISVFKDSNSKNVVALVSRISDYKRLTELYDSSELALILTDFRKLASAIISQYGGIVETLVRDELVALFNVSELQDKPELRAVSAGVELLHTLAEINKHRVKDDDPQISCKIGVYSSALPVSKDTGTPSNLGLVIDPAKNICDHTSDWKLMLSEDVYMSVKDHVEVMPASNGSTGHYSVLTVEEGVINL